MVRHQLRYGRNKVSGQAPGELGLGNRRRALDVAAACLGIKLPAGRPPTCCATAALGAAKRIDPASTRGWRAGFVLSSASGYSNSADHDAGEQCHPGARAWHLNRNGEPSARSHCPPACCPARAYSAAPSGETRSWIWVMLGRELSRDWCHDPGPVGQASAVRLAGQRRAAAARPAADAMATAFSDDDLPALRDQVGRRASRRGCRGQQPVLVAGQHRHGRT